MVRWSWGHVRFRWRLRPRQATGDKAYGTLELIRTLEEQGLRAYIPLLDFDSRTAHFGKLDFTYDHTRDVYTCPGGTILPFVRPQRPYRLLLYQADAATCNSCALKERCTDSAHGRMISRSYDEEYFDHVRAYQATEP